MTDAYGAVRSRAGKVVGGRYRITRLLGAGGMGEVYEAQHAKISRRFAVKFLHAAYASNPEIVARFQREAESAGALENENIAAVLDFGTADDGAPYLAMEFLEGQDLAHLMKATGPLPVPRATYIIIQACRGLAAAHAREIVHRDLKPENLFVCRRGDGSDLVKVLDFGIAKLHTARSFTQTGMTMGTPAYMSPEQARGAKDVDHRTDVYALGVILYEMLSGSNPHPGDENLAILYHVTTQDPVPLDIARPGLPEGLPTVVAKTMARDPADRYATVIELMQALIPFAGRAVTPAYSQIGMAASGGALGATMVSPVSLPAVGVSATPEAGEPATAAQPGPRRGQRAIVIGSAIAVAAVAAILGMRTRTPSVPVAASPPPSELPAARPSPSLLASDSASVPAPAPDAAIVPATETTVSPSERPPEQRQRRTAKPARAPLSGEGRAQPPENPPIPSEPRRRPTRAIDRANPFDD